MRRLQAASGGESLIMSWEKEQEERKETTKRQQTRWKQTRGNRREVNMSSSSGSNNSDTGDQKERWRQCAGAIIFNKHMEVLIGRRKEKGNYWQFPQGGIEAVYFPPPRSIPSLPRSLASCSLSPSPPPTPLFLARAARILFLTHVTLPQGEHPAESAIREVYEEMGIR